MGDFKSNCLNFEKIRKQNKFSDSYEERKVRDKRRSNHLDSARKLKNNDRNTF